MTEVSLRASSVATLFDCPARWEAIHINGEDMPSSGAACLGSAVHHSTAIHDQAKLAGEEMKIVDSAREVIEYIKDPPGEVQWTDISEREARGLGVQLHSLYCQQLAPQQNYVAVETPLEPLRVEINSQLTIVITGTLDRVREIDGKHGVCDIKTGARAVDSEGHASTTQHKPQLGVYELLAEQTLDVEIDLPASVIGLKTNKNAAMAQDDVPDARAALVNLYLPAAAMYFESGLFPGNPRSMLCSQKYCPIYKSCQWRG